MRILILDDDVELAATLADVLRLDGHEAMTVTKIDDAQQALDSSGPFDVAVFDLNLEEDNSIRLLRHVKSMSSSIRVLAMTGGGKVEAGIGIPLATANGADGVLFKPFSNDEFLEAVTADNGPTGS